MQSTHRWLGHLHMMGWAFFIAVSWFLSLPPPLSPLLCCRHRCSCHFAIATVEDALLLPQLLPLLLLSPMLVLPMLLLLILLRR